MSTVEVTIDIKAPIERVWETVMDPARLEDWVTIHREVKAASPPPLHSGASMEQVLCLRGVNFSVNWTLAEMTEPTSARWEGRGPAHSRALIRYELSSQSDGSTCFSYTNQFTPPGGALGNMASRVIVGGLSEREARNSLERLKSLLERN